MKASAHERQALTNLLTCMKKKKKERKGKKKSHVHTKKHTVVYSKPAKNVAA